MAENVKIFNSLAISGANSAVRREQSTLRAALAHYSSAGTPAGKEPAGKVGKASMTAKSPKVS
jgi:hypothetical protein